MIKEAIAYMFDLGLHSKPEYLKVPSEPEHVYYLRDEAGVLVRTVAEELPEDVKAFDLETVGKFTTTTLERSRILEANGIDAWYSLKGASVRYGVNRSSSMTFETSHSEQMRTLIQFGQSKQFISQAELIRVLRTTFRNNLSLAGEIVNILRKVNFSSVVQGHGEITSTKTSLGKTLTNEVTGAGIIPETVKFFVPVFAQSSLAGIMYTVECVLEPEPSNGTFRIFPLPGQIEAANEYATKKIGEAFREVLPPSVEMYHGTPV